MPDEPKFRLLLNKADTPKGAVLSFQVVTYGEEAVPGKVIRIMNVGPQGYTDTPPTDDHGAVIFNFEWQDGEKEKRLICLVLGTSVDAKRTLRR